MGISDSMYYSVIKNRDLTYEKINKEMNLLYEAHKDYLISLALFSEDGTLIAASPVGVEKEGVDVTKVLSEDREKYILED